MDEFSAVDAWLGCSHFFLLKVNPFYLIELMHGPVHECTCRVPLQTSLYFFVGKYQVVEILGCIESIYKTLLKSTMLSSKLVKCLEIPQW